MKDFKTFLVGVLLLLPFFIGIISNSLLLILLSTMYLIAIINIVPSRFWKRFLIINKRLSLMLEDK